MSRIILRARLCRLAQVAVLAVICNALVSTTSARTTDDLWKSAQSLYSAGKNAEALPLAIELEALARKQLGARRHRHDGYLRIVTLLGNVQFKVGRYSAARKQYETALKVARSTHGKNHLRYAQALQNLGGLEFTVGQAKRAAVLLERSLRILRRTRGNEHSQVAIAMDNLAVVYRSLENYRSAEKLQRRALSILERNHGPDHLILATRHLNLGNLYKTTERFNAAEKHYLRSQNIFAAKRGPAHPETANAMSALALLFADLKRHREALPLYRRVLAIQQKALHSKHPNLAVTYNNLGSLLDDMGQIDAAERYYKQALELNEELYGSNHARVATALDNLGNVYRKRRQYQIAEPLLRRALETRKSALGDNHSEVAWSRNNLAIAMKGLGRLDEAEAQLSEALRTMEQTLGRDHLRVASVSNNLGGIYRLQKRFVQAQAHYQRALKIRRKKLGKAHIGTADILNNLGALETDQGQYLKAEKYYDRSLSVVRRQYGNLSPRVALTLRNSGIASLRRGALESARQKFAEAVRIAEAQTQLIRQNENDTETDSVVTSRVFDNLVDVNWLLAERSPEQGLALRNEAFLAAQNRLRTSASVAIEKMAQRSDDFSPALKNLLRHFQDLTMRRRELNSRLLSLLAKASTKKQQGHLATVRGELATVTDQLSRLEDELGRQQPAAADLVKPEPMDIDEVAGHLADEQVLVVISLDYDGGYIWAVDRTKSEWVRILDSREQIAHLVTRLRQTLDPAKLLEAGASFDLAVSFRLYKKLLQPIETLLAGKKELMLVASGALTGLPFHVLTTSPSVDQSDDPSRYRTADWLVRRLAVTVLPAVSSIRALEAAKQSRPAELPIVGYGDPVFKTIPKGNNTAQPGSDTVTHTSEVGVARLGKLSQNLVRLKETADELRIISRVVGGNADALHLRKSATEANVKTTDLKSYRIVYFATHALLAEEVKSLAGLSEPALALTLPQRPSTLDDGLLTASEVATLKLNANWVVLSACNTAAGQQPGAEALSGLARAFFYAGARSLLVSHWPVASDPAVKLTTRMFDELARSPQIGKSEALRRSMLKLINDASDEWNGHPAIWAPFVVVGQSRVAGQR